MSSNQIAGNTSEIGGIITPEKGSANKSEADSASVALNRENAFVTGALRVSEDSLNPRFGSQGSDGSISLMLPIERSSLETLERAPSLAHVALPENQEAVSTALPDSIDDGSDGSISLVSPIETSSLDALERAPSLAHVALPENQEAVSTALPDSIDGGSSQEFLNFSNHGAGQASGQGLQFEEGTFQEPVVPVLKSYASTIKLLSSHLPHLKNVQSRSRRKNVNVTCYDYAGDALASVKAFTGTTRTPELQTTEGMSLAQYLGDTPSENLQFRLIVATDLSTTLIECLGTLFSMSPEVYEEHLVNSGWRNGTYNDQEPDTWVTRDMKKSHMSIRWYRPVKRTLQQPYSTAERKELLTSRTLPFPWTEAVPDKHGKPHGVKHKLRPATNILRRDWDIKTDAEAAISVGSFAAWEERATIWSKQHGSFRIVVLLLDPLPIVKDEMSGAAEALQRLGVYQPEPTATNQGTNRGLAENQATGSSVTDQPTRGLVKSSTFFRSRPKADQNFSILSLRGLLFGRPQQPQDPSSNDGPPTQRPEASQATEDPESGQPGTGRQKRTFISRPTARSRVPKWLGRVLGRSEKRTEKIDQGKDLNIIEEKDGTEIKTLEPMDRCIFEGLYPRGPVVDYDFLMDPENIDLLAGYLDRTKATAANLKEWLTHSDGRRSTKVGPTSHLEYLFEIIHNDTMNTLRHMEVSLREIGQHILDDSLIQQRLVHWRLLLERFGTELQQLEDSLRRFAIFINASGYPHPVNTESPEEHGSPIERLLEDSVAQISFVRQLTTRSHKSLMANMSIVESKRGIAEAESVTKLTELAFFFIPLTFSASIFSMQVKELNASRISIAAFFILAIIITTASYALRLVIRSQKVIRGQRELLKNIRYDAGLAPGTPVPTRFFIAWVSRRIWRRVGLLTIIVTFQVALLVTPVAVLWTRELNHGFKIMLTILLLTFILVASLVTANAMLYIDGRGLHLRRDIFKPGLKANQRPYQTPLSISQKLAQIFSWLSSRWFLIGLAATGVGAAPSAALWTSPLTLGIKVGVTIVLGMLYVCAIVYLVLKQAGNKGRSPAMEEETD